MVRGVLLELFRLSAFKTSWIFEICELRVFPTQWPRRIRLLPPFSTACGRLRSSFPPSQLRTSCCSTMTALPLPSDECSTWEDLSRRPRQPPPRHRPHCTHSSPPPSSVPRLWCDKPMPLPRPRLVSHLVCSLHWWSLEPLLHPTQLRRQPHMKCLSRLPISRTRKRTQFKVRN